MFESVAYASDRGYWDEVGRAWTPETTLENANTEKDANQTIQPQIRRKVSFLSKLRVECTGK